MISVIVPYKDAADYLGRCLESLHNQEGDFEFVLVDDGSKDVGPDIVEAYVKVDSRFRTFENIYRPGVSGARNTGLREAWGEWITFLDADDMMNDGAYTMFTDAIKLGKKDKINIFQFNHYRYYAKVKKTALKYTNGTGLYELDELPLVWYCVWNKLYNAEFLDGLIFDATMQFGEDELFSMSTLARDGRILCCNGVTTTHVFENEGSLSKIRTEKDIFKMIQAYTAFLKKHTDPEVRRAVCNRLSVHFANLFMDSLTEVKDA